MDFSLPRSAHSLYIGIPVPGNLCSAPGAVFPFIQLLFQEYILLYCLYFFKGCKGGVSVSFSLIRVVRIKSLLAGVLFFGAVLMIGMIKALFVHDLALK